MSVTRVAAIALTLLVFVVTATTATGAAGQETLPGSGDGLGQLASCVHERGHLLVLGLVDESGSLRTTDPQARRVDGLRTALATLANSGGQAGDSDSVKIEVLLAGFSSDYSASSAWSALNRDTLPALQEQAERFATRDQGRDTDFVAALQGAQDTLGRRVAEITATGAPPPCRALLLFTDGAYDIDPRTGGETKPYAPDLPLDVPGNDEQVEDIGRGLVCAPNGLADQLRASSTTVIAIALTSQIANPADQAFLEGIGRRLAPGGSSCGDRGDPAGAYLPVDDLSGLLEAFHNALALDGTPREPVNVPVCPGTACPQGRLEFQIDPSLREFSLLVNLGAPGVIAEVTSPAGASPLRLGANQAGTFALGSATLSVTPVSPLDLVIDAQLPAGTDDWVGTWAVTFIDPTGQNPGAVARSQIILFGGLTPVVDPLPVFEAGQLSAFEIRVIDRAGAPRTPAGFVRSAQVSAAVTDPVTGIRQDLDVRPSSAGSGRYESAYTVPQDTTASSLVLTLTLDVTTRSGVRLQPRVQTYTVPVRPPSSYPAISPPQLRLQSIVDEGQATGTLTVTGGQASGGCVWFTAATAQSEPEGAGQIQLVVDPPAIDRASCVRVAAGEQRTVQVRAAPQAVVRGTVEGFVRASVVSDADPAERQVTVPFSFEIVKSPNVPLAIGLFVLILLAGLLLPLAALWLLNTILATFLALHRTRTAHTRVIVTQEGAVEAADGAPLPPAVRDFHAVADHDRCRRFEADGLTFAVRVPFWPVRSPYGQVRCPGQPVIASQGSHRRWLPGSARVGKVPLVLRGAQGTHGTWVFVVHRIVGERVEGALHLYVADDAVAADTADLLDVVRRDLPAQARQIDIDIRRDEQAQGGQAPPPAEEAAPVFVPGEPWDLGTSTDARQGSRLTRRSWRDSLRPK
jgi:hypothetical protein